MGKVKSAVNKLFDVLKTQKTVPRKVISSGAGRKPAQTALDGGFYDTISKIDAKERTGYFMKERLTADMKNFETRMGAAKTDKDFAGIASDYGFEHKKGMTQDQMYHAAHNSLKDQIKDGPSAGDYFNAYHGPGITMAGVTGSALYGVFGSKGKLSNRELYSDPFA